MNQARQLAVTRGVSFSAGDANEPEQPDAVLLGHRRPSAPAAQVFTGAETDASGWRRLENGSRITAGPTITFNSLGAATAAGVLRVQNSSATGSLDVCVSPSGRIRVQAVGTACP